METASAASNSWLELLRLAQPVSLILVVVCYALAIDPSTTRGPRRRRSHLLGLSLVTLAATFLASGVLLVVRAVVPDKTWTPALTRWHNVEYQSLLGLVGIGSLPVLLAWQQRQHGPGVYSISAVWWAATLGGVADVAILALYVFDVGSDVEQWKVLTPWTWAQLGVEASRVFVFWPILVVLASISADGRGVIAGETSAAAAGQGEDARLASNAAAAATSTSGAGESTALLSARTHPADYGGTASAGPSSNGTTTPNKSSTKPNAAAGAAGPPSAASAANASMGLSMASAPPPPTFRVFFQRIVMLFPYLWPSKSPLLQLLALVCVGLLLVGRLVNIAVPIVLGKIVDRLASTESGNGGTSSSSSSLSIWWLIGGYALLKCLQGSGGLLTVAQNFAWLPLQQFSDRSMSMMAFRHLLDLSMSFHTKRKTGEVLRILDRGSSINAFFQYLVFSVTPIFFDIGIATVFLSVTFGPQVGLLLFAIMTVYTSVSIKLTTWRTSLRRDANNKDSVSRAIHTDVLLNWETVKSYNNEGYEAERYRLSFLDYQGADWKVNASLNALNLVQNLILSVGTLLMLFVVAYDVTKGYASSSDFVVFISYLAQIYQPLNMLSTLYRVIQTSLVDTDKLIALLQEERDIKDIPGATELDVKEGVVEFRDVQFSYDGKVDALKSLSFTMKPKSRVALVGESGAGKSSILKLLYRFYDPSSGQILIDGQDIRTVTQSSLRKAIGVVPQEAGLLNTSIRTNIAYGRTDPAASNEEVEAAAAAAQILDKILSFPEGMDTVVGERGVRLSGGEKQRVAIARTFLKAPPILLLDEATSALDSQTERHLQAALQTLMEGKTSLTIAHRLSTIVNSDQIIVLSSGAVVESGTHEELVAKGGRYASMWAAQVETDRERAAGKEVITGQEQEGATEVVEAEAEAVAVPARQEGAADSQQPQSPSAADNGKAKTATTDEDGDAPAPGMLGIVSPSQVDSAAIAAVSPPLPAPTAVESAQEAVDEPATMPAVVDKVEGPAEQQQQRDVEVETEPEQQQQQQQRPQPYVVPSSSSARPPSSSGGGGGRGGADSSSIMTSSSSSGTTGGSKMRTRIASLMRRTTSSGGVSRSREGSPSNSPAAEVPPGSDGATGVPSTSMTSEGAGRDGQPPQPSQAGPGAGGASGGKKKNKKKGKK